MSKNNKKFYVVWVGHKPGIYTSWDACKSQTDGFPAARYKAFPTKAEAEAAFKSSPPAIVRTSTTKKATGTVSSASIIPYSIAVDAACSGNPGDMEYRGVVTATYQELFHKGPMKDGTNNIGEFLAIVHALALFHKTKPDLVIYTDSKTAMSWVKKKKANTKLEVTRYNTEIFELIARAEKWLEDNPNYTNPILKWDTAKWGEIPADFGRK